MKFSVLPALSLVGLAALLQTVLAVGPVDADLMFQKFNDAFLVTSGSDVYYKAALNDGNPDILWRSSLDIMAVQDVYERTGSPDTKTLVNNLLTSWLKNDNNKPPWSWDGWNDDIGWFSMALVRGYIITGNMDFLTQARYGFDYAFERGWDTTYNDGGIWEENPEYVDAEDDPKPYKKEALANDSLGKVACMIYQATHDQWYLDRCRQIYDWVWNHLFDSDTGQIYTGVWTNGDIDDAYSVYNQGTFLDYANLVWEISGDTNVYNDAVRVIDFARNKNSIFNNPDVAYTWADDMARGVGHFVRDNRLWGTYYTWMYQNAAAILNNRRTDLGITWNAWNMPTPIDNTLLTPKFVGALAWLQYTPAVQPDEIGGIHIISNQLTGMAIDSAGTFGNGNNVVQWGPNGGINQRWQLTQNSDNSWNIVSLSTWQALDCPAGNTANGVVMVQWKTTRDNNQRWSISKESDGSYRIVNLVSGAALDGSSSTTNGEPLVQWGWNGGSQQKWILR